MIARYAGVIVDGKVEALDRVFSYRIPEALSDRIRPGVRKLPPAVCSDPCAALSGSKLL